MKEFKEYLEMATKQNVKIPKSAATTINLVVNKWIPEAGKKNVKLEATSDKKFSILNRETGEVKLIEFDGSEEQTREIEKRLGIEVVI